LGWEGEVFCLSFSVWLPFDAIMNGSLRVPEVRDLVASKCIFSAREMLLGTSVFSWEASAYFSVF